MLQSKSNKEGEPSYCAKFYKVSLIYTLYIHIFYICFLVIHQLDDSPYSAKCYKVSLKLKVSLIYEICLHCTYPISVS